MGLTGEAGEVAEHAKKILRDDEGRITPERRGAVIKELGDVLWYLTMAAKEIGSSLHDVAQVNMGKVAERAKTGTLHGSGSDREEAMGAVARATALYREGKCVCKEIDQVVRGICPVHPRAYAHPMADDKANKEAFVTMEELARILDVLGIAIQQGAAGPRFKELVEELKSPE